MTPESFDDTYDLWQCHSRLVQLEHTAALICSTTEGRLFANVLILPHSWTNWIVEWSLVKKTKALKHLKTVFWESHLQAVLQPF